MQHDGISALPAKGRVKRLDARTPRVAIGSPQRLGMGVNGQDETFARMLQNAFDDCLVQMTRAARKVRADALTASPLVQQAVRETPGQFSRLVDRLADYGLTIPFQERFGALAERAAPAAWIRALLEHHTRVQRQKPPAGREPWMLIDSGEYLLRPLYRRDTADGDPDAYAHTYRTAALWQFAMDLGKVT